MTEVVLRKNWKIRTTDRTLYARLVQYRDVKFPEGYSIQHVRGKFGKQSAVYPIPFTQQIWKAICDSTKMSKD